VLLGSGLLASVAGAEADHLQGYPVTDLAKIQPPGSYSIKGVYGTATCTLKKPKFFLMQVEKNAGDDPRGDLTPGFICYPARCTGGVPTGFVTAEDQFGTHTLKTRKTQIICAPANHRICGNGVVDPGEQCDGGAGPCPGTCSGTCTCGGAPCQATTGGFCWFWSEANVGCDTTCANAFRTYDDATESFAGSGGTDANCAAVLSDIIHYPVTITGQACAVGYGVGCYTSISPSGRCITPPTNASDHSGANRICACH
jgi:hypothetical protein